MENQNGDTPEILVELSEETQLKIEVIQSLMQPCDQNTYGQRLKEAAQKLGKSVRTVQRLVKKWETEGVVGLTSTQRSDKGNHRFSQDWQDFIIRTYREGNKNGKRMSRKQVAMRVQARAAELGEEKYPNYRTVYRILQPLMDELERKNNIRSRGWQGGRLSLKTRDGQDLQIEYSNQVWQCDHTRVDVLLVDKGGELLGRPWLTTIIDSYSRCVMGIWLGFDAPSSQVVSLALRHAILPKRYNSEYALHCQWGTYGTPQYFYTDGGKDFRSNHLQQIGIQLGFNCLLRSRPSEGGVVERPFGTLNTELFSTLPGYTGSNVQQRPKKAEKNASLTLKELERLIVRYIVDNYNQRIDARMRDQTRYQRWESGLLAIPDIPSERELDICLMKQTNRTIYREGYVRFENLMYKGEYLAAYAGERVVLRYDPIDITTIWVYRKEAEKEVFLSRAHAQDLEAEQVSWDELKMSNRKLREQGKMISNQSILNEIRDRDLFLVNKSRKDRQKAEQADVYPVQQPETEASETVESSQTEISSELPEVLDWEEMRQNYEF